MAAQYELLSQLLKSGGRLDMGQELFYKFYQAFVLKDRWLQYIGGVGTTLLVTAIALAMGVLLGSVVALVRVAHDQQRPGRRNPVLGVFNAVCQVYTTVIRGTPMMVQLLIMSMVIFNNSRNFTMVGALALGINSGAYVSEIIRGGLMSLDPGQAEAGRSLGLGYIDTMRLIVIPQAFKAILPALGNEFIMLLKDTSLITVIGGTIDGKTSVSAKENDTLTVVLDQNEIPDGMTFDMWSISSSKLSGDINVDYRAEAMTFQMPAEDVTIRAQYRSAEIIEDAAPSPLATAATIAVGGAAAGIVVWQGVNLGVDLYLANALPQGVPVPTDRRALALLLWETAGKPEVALPTLYGDIPAEEIELQKATHWAVQNGLMDAADKKDASFFDPDHYVTKMDVFGAWLRLKKLLGTIGTSPT